MKSHRTKRGFTLIELVTVMSITTLLMGIAVGTIHMALHTERNAAKQAWSAASLARVSQLFPKDVHAATAAVLAQEANRPPSLELTFPGERSIRYATDGNSVSRIETAAGKVQHRDELHFPEFSEIQFEREAAPDLIRMVIARPAGFAGTVSNAASAANGKSLARLRILQLEAVLGRDRRFEKVPQPTPPEPGERE